MIQIDLDVAADEEIQLAVLVVVGEATAGRPTADRDAGLLGDVGERSVVVVPVQTVSAKRGDVQIFPSIAVEIGGAHAHAPPWMREP